MLNQPIHRISFYWYLTAMALPLYRNSNVTKQQYACCISATIMPLSSNNILGNKEANRCVLLMNSKLNKFYLGIRILKDFKFKILNMNHLV